MAEACLLNLKPELKLKLYAPAIVMHLAPGIRMFWNIIAEAGAAIEAVCASNRHAPSPRNTDVFESGVAAEAVAEAEAANEVVERRLNLKLQSKL